jgi:hypothetical protein
MLKKILLSSLIFTVSTSLSYAGVFYAGPSLQYESLEANTSYQAISPRLTFGYSSPLNDVYCLAGELFAVAGTIDNHPGNSDLKNTPNFGISILPGFMFGQQSFGFARLGMVTADFSAQDDNIYGLQAGLGVEVGITNNVDVRGEYAYTAYQNVNNTGSPKSSMAVLGLMYRFK